MIRLLVVCWLLAGCAPVSVNVVQPHAKCSGVYAMTPDGHKWYLDCVAQRNVS